MSNRQHKIGGSSCPSSSQGSLTRPAKERHYYKDPHTEDLTLPMIFPLSLPPSPSGKMRVVDPSEEARHNPTPHQQPTLPMISPLSLPPSPSGKMRVVDPSEEALHNPTPPQQPKNRRADKRPRHTLTAADFSRRHPCWSPGVRNLRDLLTLTSAVSPLSSSSSSSKPFRSGGL